MNTAEQIHRLSHPFYKLSDLPEDQLRNKVSSMSRIEIIEWLEWNDHNGIYSDEKSLAEFENVMSKAEGEAIMLKQILENR